MNEPRALRELRAVSARIGADPLLIQAGGGNTSIKDDGVLWVKASGRWLANATIEAMFVPLRLAGVRERIACGDADPVGPELLHELTPPGLRPSIEATLHALLPQRVVLHAHAVDVLAWLVRGDADAALAGRLAGLSWRYQPYLRPGLPLTRALDRLLGNECCDVLLLGNHGVVVGADTPARAEALLGDVVRRLTPSSEPVFQTPPFETLAAAIEGTRYRLPDDPKCHALALDPVRCGWAARGALYPDHVVFLGGGLPCLRPHDDAQAWRGELGACDAPAVMLPGAGVVVHATLDASGQALLTCLADVLMRIEPGATLRWLPDEEVRALGNWDAERYRRAQGAARAT